MKEEVLAAVLFLIRFIEKSETFPRNQIENFKTHLTALLMKRFEKHWFPELPAKGQGYRCIRVNGLTPVDQSLEQAASKCGLSYSDLSLPTELTVWVDPSEVCYRLGESEGSYCTLATFPSSDSSSQSSLSLSSSSSSSSSASETSDSSSPLSTPPMTPTQGKPKKMSQQPKVQQQQQQQRISVDSVTKYRNLNFSNSPSPVTSIRSKPAPREMNHMHQNRPTWRCDPAPPFPLPPAIYRSYHNNYYNTRQYKNVVKV